MSRRNPVTYRRTWDGRWFRDGTLITHNPPERVLRLADNMALECLIVWYGAGGAR